MDDEDEERWIYLTPEERRLAQREHNAWLRSALDAIAGHNPPAQTAANPLAPLPAEEVSPQLE